jgi:methionyl-tRNA synthetase
MWQAMLLSAGLEPSKQIFVHGFLTVDGQKISKSIGNVINPLELTEKYGIDPVRYFLLREFPFDADGDFSYDRLEERYTSELANDLGNLASRVSNMVAQYVEGKVEPVELPEYKELITQIHAHTEQFQFEKALEKIWQIVQDANQAVNREKPWDLAKSDILKTGEVLAKMVAQIRLTADLLQPYLPETAEKLAKHFADSPISKMEPLFPRLDN